MNKVPKLCLVAVFGLFLSTIPAQANVFLTVAQDGVDKIRSKPIAYKPSLEFKQAVARYIKNTDTHFYQMVQRTTDENVSYKKELRYLFKNYSKLSSPALLSRLRSAHQTMVKTDTNVDGEAYKKYEQICSALLLTCTQVFFNDVRNQILNTLHEIDTLMVYWRYQQNHQLKYFFSKSPVKWIVGKEQGKEIAHNVIRLERKQAELYTLLGALTGHVHSFTEVGLSYDDCYTWIEQLFEIVPDIKISSDNNSDGSRFDTIAATLGLKTKRVSSFKNDCMSSIAAARKPNHFIRHWLKYAAGAAAIGYIIHYSSKNPEVVRSIVNGAQDETSKFFMLLLHPLKKIYERGKLAFSDEKKVEEPKKEEEKKEPDAVKEPMAGDANKPIPDEEKSLEELGKELLEVAARTDSNIAEELAKNLMSLRDDAINSLDEVLKAMKDPKDGILYSSRYEVNEDEIRQDMKRIATKIEIIRKNGIEINGPEAKEYDEALKRIYKTIDTLSDKLSHNVTGYELKIQLLFTKHYLKVIDQILEPIQKYTPIIDKGVLRLFQLAAVAIEKFIIQGDGLLKLAEQQLKDHELTLMFTSLIPLAAVCFGANKTYEWITTRDYSSIRIALSDVNGLLIEAASNLDDHDYGKLVYLICKLKDRATYLKDSMTDEFLADVAKLESKQYSTQIKRGIVENMFNKYAFLGRIAVV